MPTADYVERTCFPRILGDRHVIRLHSLSFASALNSGEEDVDCGRVLDQQPATPTRGATLRTWSVEPLGFHELARLHDSFCPRVTLRPTLIRGRRVFLFAQDQPRRQSLSVQTEPFRSLDRNEISEAAGFDRRSSTLLQPVSDLIAQ